MFCGRTLERTRYDHLSLLAGPSQPCAVAGPANGTGVARRADTLERKVAAHVRSLYAKLRQIDVGLDPIQTHCGLVYRVAPA